MRKIITNTMYVNAVVAILIGICSLTMHNILIGVAFACIAKHLFDE